MNYKVAITGASSGIGMVTALQLSLPEVELILIGRNEPTLLALSAQCLAIGAKSATPIACDIREPHSCVRIGDAMCDGPSPDRFGLVNAAGIGAFGSSSDFRLRDCQAMVETNLLGTIYVTQACLPELLSRRGSVIATIHSVAATQALAGAAIYGATKAGTLQYCRSLRAEFRGKGLIVSDLILGATNTPIWDSMDTKFDVNDMIPCELAAKHLSNLILQDQRASIDEVHLLPSKGVL